MSTDEPETNPYELLGLNTESTEQEVRTAYRKLSLKVHPDRVCAILSNSVLKLTFVHQNPNNPSAGVYIQQSLRIGLLKAF